jgi:hypothetical protein
MKRNDFNHCLCLMLAFQSVITHGKKANTDNVEKIMELAQQMSEFCDLYYSKTFPSVSINFVNDRWTLKIDHSIERYKDELKARQTTQLPKDKETLIQLYDRLQQRKSRRMQKQLFASAKEEKLTDLILNYLTEEIEDIDMEGKQ